MLDNMVAFRNMDARKHNTRASTGNRGIDKNAKNMEEKQRSAKDGWG